MAMHACLQQTIPNAVMPALCKLAQVTEHHTDTVWPDIYSSRDDLEQLLMALSLAHHTTLKQRDVPLLCNLSSGLVSYRY